MKITGIALLGVGVVGGGTYQILTEKREFIKKHQNVDLQVVRVLEKNVARAKSLGIDENIVTQNIDNIVNDDSVKIVAEFMGGVEPARTFLLKCLAAGKSVVTANKEMLSKHWHELEAEAKKSGAGLYFEASCVGGVPIIRTLKNSLQGDTIKSITGIVNGTTNFILTKMSDEGKDYDEVLKEAQALGYAEANPVADVDGFDAMYKLSILSSLAFRTKVPLTAIDRKGISSITKEDIAFGKDLGYTLKLLAIAKNTEKGICAKVQPTFIPNSHPLASIKGSFNAVFLVGDYVGDIMLYGRGAGALPTGSAIVSDIVFAAKDKKPSYTSFKNTDKAERGVKFIDDENGFYIHLTVKDKIGVLAKITKTLSSKGISLKSVFQKSADEELVPLILITHKTTSKLLSKAMEEVEKFDEVVKVNNIICVE